MTRIRILLFLLTIIVVGVFGFYMSFYARGYRLNLKTLKFEPNGILVIKSEPDGASVYINGSFKTATNATISLPPGVYDIEVKRDGYFKWYKRLTIEKEIVTFASVSLFRNAPSLAPLTFFGAENPVASDDGSKIVFTVPPSVNAGPDKIGIYTMDTFSLPLGFTNEPKRIVDGDHSNSTYQFSPDNRQILLNTSKGVYLIDSGSFTTQAQMVNVSPQKEAILKKWQSERETRNLSLIKNLPIPVADLLTHKTSNFKFSPDQNMILYQASESANLPNNLIPPLPGSSTQKEERNIQKGNTYVYDIKEDRNFFISNQENPTIRWLTTSKHLMSVETGKVEIMDYDGTNRVAVYSGSFESPYAFPYNNAAKILILTNLGGNSAVPNLYTLTIK